MAMLTVTVLEHSLESSCSTLFFSFLRVPSPARSTLFPYTTLFRSAQADGVEVRHAEIGPYPADVRRQRRLPWGTEDRKSTRLNSSHTVISYAVFCLKKKTKRMTCT